MDDATGDHAPTFWTLVERRAASRPDDLVAADDGGDSVSGVGLLDRAQALAGRLLATGLRPGDTVSWILPSSVEAVVLIAALARLGVVQNPIVPIYGEREITFIVRQVGSRLLLTPETFRGIELGAMGRKVAADLGVGWSDLDGLPAAGRALPAPPTDAGAPRWVFYTSGTTSDPKGVRHADRTLVLAGRCLARTGLRDGSRWGGAVPITHVGVPSLLTRVLEVGASMHLVKVFDPIATCDRFREWEVDVVAGVGALVAAMLTDQAGHREPRFPALRTLISGGGPKLHGLAERARDDLGCTLAPSYGLTECPYITAAAPDDPIDAIAAGEGVPGPGVDLRIVGPDGQAMTPGDEGEVRVKAPQLFLGYVDASLDQDALDEDGYLRTGDLGYVRSDGHLVISGRVKEVIVRNGENLATREIEDLLLQHPDVADATVVGLPDDVVGERVCAVVVERDGAGLDLEAVRRFCQERGLMRQKVPVQLELLDAIPRNPMGKAMKPQLRQRLGGD